MIGLTPGGTYFSSVRQIEVRCRMSTRIGLTAMRAPFRQMDLTAFAFRCHRRSCRNGSRRAIAAGIMDRIRWGYLETYRPLADVIDVDDRYPVLLGESLDVLKPSLHACCIHGCKPAMARKSRQGSRKSPQHPSRGNSIRQSLTRLTERSIQFGSMPRSWDNGPSRSGAGVFRWPR